MNGSSSSRPAVVVICGPTASGKTGISLALAEHFGIEIISADSRQVYRGMDIGTAKASAAERAVVPHHLVNVVDPDENFTAADFARLGHSAIDEISGRQRLPVVVGGTGLYIRTLTEGLVSAPAADPMLRKRFLELEKRDGEGTLYERLRTVDSPVAESVSPRDLLRIVRALEVHALTGRRLSDMQADHAFGERPFRTLKIATWIERDELYRRIDRRVEEMMEAGLVREVESLLASGYSAQCKGMRTIGYQEIVSYLQGDLSCRDAVELIKRNSRRYSKRQMTWFRKENSLIWLDSLRESDRILALIENFMHPKRSGHG